MLTEIRFSGVGGQGVVLASVILAEGAGVYGGLKVAQSQFYAAAIQGGSSQGDVIISDRDIAFPWVLKPDVLVALAMPCVNFAGYDIPSEYASASELEGAEVDLEAVPPKDSGILVTDSTTVKYVPPIAAEIYRAPFLATADGLGNRRGMNLVAVGFVVRLTGVVDIEHVVQAVRHRVPPATVEKNLGTLMAGYNLDPASLEASRL